MSNIWPPQTFSVADGTFTVTSTALRWGSIQSRSHRSHENRVTLSGSKSRLGATTPGYFQKAATGNLPVQRLDFDEETVQATSGRHFTQTTPWFGYYDQELIQGNGMPDVSPFGVDFKDVSDLQYSNLRNKVQQQVLQNLKGSDINLAQVVAERNQTARTIAEAIRRISKARNALNKGKFMEAAQALGLTLTKSLSRKERAWRQSMSLSRGWLELQYGWRPLVNDIYGAAAEMRKSHNKTGYMVFHSRGSLSSSWQTQWESGPKRIVEDTSVSATVKVTLKVRRVNPLLGSLSSLGLTNPATIAWELTPYSFVVDWALPLGSFIAQLDASLGYTFVDSCVTTYKKQTYDASAFSIKPTPPGYDIVDIDLRQHAERLDVTRFPYSGFADLLSLPYFKDPMSATHVANALALLRVSRR